MTTRAVSVYTDDEKAAILKAFSDLADERSFKERAKLVGVPSSTLHGWVYGNVRSRGNVNSRSTVLQPEKTVKEVIMETSGTKDLTTLVNDLLAEADRIDDQIISFAEITSDARKFFTVIARLVDMIEDYPRLLESVKTLESRKVELTSKLASMV